MRDIRKRNSQGKPWLNGWKTTRFQGNAELIADARKAYHSHPN
jgi:hypothetical protein